MDEVVKKTVVVTGSSRGIGAGIAKIFGAGGWDVVVTYVGYAQAADAVVYEIKSAGGSASAIRCNTRNEG
jgi:3-oxoacyl-[acyl-carrier protein] reductase